MARTIAKDHDAKRDQIRRAAARVFARDGFDRASMAQLARECGVSKAALYHYYDGKDAILHDLLRAYLIELRDRVRTAADGDGPAAGRLRAAVFAILRAYQGADDVHRLQINGFAMLPEDARRELRGYQREVYAAVAGVMREIAPGALAAEDRLRAATMSVFGMVNWYFMWSRDAGAAERAAYADTVTALTLNGVGGL